MTKTPEKAQFEEVDDKEKMASKKPDNWQVLISAQKNIDAGSDDDTMLDNVIKSEVSLLKHDLRSIEEVHGKNIVQNISDNEKDNLWLLLENYRTNNINISNVDEMVYLSKHIDAIKNETTTNLATEKEKLAEITAKKEELQNKFAGLKRYNWPNRLPIVSYFYQDFHKIERKNIKEEVATLDRKIDEQTSKIEQIKNKLSIVNKYGSELPNKLIRAKTEKEVERILKFAQEALDSKYKKKISNENKIFWEFTKLNTKKELLNKIKDQLFKLDFDKIDFRKDLEKSMAKINKSISNEKIVVKPAPGTSLTDYKYQADPAEWGYYPSYFLSEQDPDKEWERKINNWDWQEYKKTFTSSKKLTNINNFLEDAILIQLINEQKKDQKYTLDTIFKFSGYQRIMPQALVKIKKTIINGENIEPYLRILDRFRQDGFDISSIDNLLTSSDRGIRAMVPGRGYNLKRMPEDMFLDEDKDWLKIYFDPQSVFNSKHIRGWTRLSDQFFFKSGYKRIKRHEKYGRMLLERGDISDKDFRLFYNNEFSGDIAEYTNFILKAARDREDYQQIFIDFEEDISSRVKLNGATRYVWNLITDNTNVSRENIWRKYEKQISQDLEKDPPTKLRVLLGMAEDGFVPENQIMDKFGKTLIDNTLWSQANEFAGLMKKIKSLNQDELKEYYNNLWQSLLHAETLDSFKNQAKEINALIKTTGSNEKNIYRMYKTYLLDMLDGVYDRRTVAFSKYFATKSGENYVSVIKYMLSRTDEKDVRKNELVKYLLKPENKQELKEYLYSIADYQQGQEQGKKNIESFLGKIKAKNLPNILRELVLNGLTKEGRRLNQYLFDNYDKESHYNFKLLKDVRHLYGLTNKLGWDVNYVTKKGDWQTTLNQLKKQIAQKLANRNESAIFITNADKGTYQALFGNNAVTNLLNSLPESELGQYSGYKRYALTHHEKDELTKWLKSMNTRTGLTLDEKRINLCADFIRENGISENDYVFGLYHDLWMREKGGAELSTRVQESGVTSLADLAAKIEAIDKSVAADKFAIDLGKIINAEKKLLDINLKISQHTHGASKNIDVVIRDYLNLKEEIDKIKTPAAYTNFDIEVEREVTGDNLPAEYIQKYHAIVDGVKNNLRSEWRESWNKYHEQIQGQPLGKKDLANIDEIGAFEWMIKNYESIPENSRSRYDKLLKRMIWKVIINKDFPIEEEGNNFIENINSPDKMADLRAYVDTNIIEHAISGHEESLSQIWGKDLAEIIGTEKVKERLLSLFNSDKQELISITENINQAKSVAGKTTVRYVTNRDLISYVSGYIGNACYTSKTSFLKDYNGTNLPLVIPYRMVCGEKVIGSVLLFEIKDKEGNPDAILVRAHNIPGNPENVNMEELIEKFLDQIQSMARTRNASLDGEEKFTRVVVPGVNTGAISNDANSLRVIGGYRKEANQSFLDSSFDFNGYELQQDTYLAREIT